MGKKPRKTAYVVRRGRIPGIYYSWEECSAQVTGFPKNSFQGYDSRSLAEEDWEQYRNQLPKREILGELDPLELSNAQLAAEQSWRDQPYKRKHLPEIIPDEVINTDYPRSAKFARVAAMEKNIKPTRVLIEISDDDEEERKPRQIRHNATAIVPKIEEDHIISIQRGNERKLVREDSMVTAKILENQADFISLVDDDTAEERPTPRKLVKEETPIILTPAQQAVVNLAVAGHNIFLTGAAGSGKTATLKEILRLLRKKHHDEEDAQHPAIQIVAPTGIAALPLNGKTTYSFAGWNPDTPKKPLKDLLQNVTKRVRTTMHHIEVLIIEEISMVENAFLERLNMYMQALVPNQTQTRYGDTEPPSEKPKPFGGKQIILVGDFHQLPPVKPFENCILCGEPMEMNPSDESKYCDTAGCKYKGIVYHERDKWAFKAPAWNLLKLRHVKLEQIHRQKDASFQTMLNKIRNGQSLEDAEWSQLTTVKNHQLPPMRLMSLLRSVDGVNTRELALIRREEKGWVAYDEGRILRRGQDDEEYYEPPPQIIRELETYMKSLHDGSFTTHLKLKVGAKIVLLTNLDLKGGLVNGTQGTVVSFTNTEGWAEKMCGEWSKEKIAIIKIFQTKAGFCCPIVRFANGKTNTIFPEYMASLRGPSTRRCIVSRTQIPLKLAWALSIHKSQGMTLQNVMVSRKHLFASGQLYVGLSRATTIEGLTVTDYTKEQFTVEAADEDVVKFYTETAWEDLGPSNDSG